jgi:hypothetical protein
MVDYLAATVNRALRDIEAATTRDPRALEQERARLDAELGNLVAFVAQGDLSPRLREEIRTREERLAGIDQELTGLHDLRQAPLQAHRSWIEDKLQNLKDLLGRDPQGARRELQKHLEELQITPAPEAGEQVVRVTGRAKIDGLLETEEAVRLQLVAGAGYAECHTASATYWIDLMRP